MPKWTKAPPELIELFESILPGPPATKRQMFGYPAAFVNGNMFAGLFQDRMMVRLPEGERAKLNAKPFEPMPGRPMKEYVEAAAATLASKPKVKALVKKAFEYGSSLPEKKGKKK